MWCSTEASVCSVFRMSQFLSDCIVGFEIHPYVVFGENPSDFLGNSFNLKN